MEPEVARFQSTKPLTSQHRTPRKDILHLLARHPTGCTASRRLDVIPLGAPRLFFHAPAPPPSNLPPRDLKHEPGGRSSPPAKFAIPGARTRRARRAHLEGSILLEELPLFQWKFFFFTVFRQSGRRGVRPGLRGVLGDRACRHAVRGTRYALGVPAGPSLFAPSR
ncbi:hypothetical protein DENSPDRAFT_881540 [Dentipellis sp. KUC8613]|nr:hypothetical protein DENSPDRAFT_881540 [Dentipellis sp. KUC8613]